MIMKLMHFFILMILSYTGDPEEISKLQIERQAKVKVLEIKKDLQKSKVGLKQTQKDP